MYKADGRIMLLSFRPLTRLALTSKLGVSIERLPTLRAIIGVNRVSGSIANAR